MDTPATAKATALTIAKELEETSTDARNQIEQIVLLLGTEKTLAFLRKAQETQKQGGLLVLSQVRKRTPGGVFFYLVKTEGPEDVKKLFVWKTDRKNKTSAPAKPEEADIKAAKPRSA